MSSGGRLITKGIHETLPSFMQYILWYLIETMDVEEKDYLQIFKLDSTIVDGKRKQAVRRRIQWRRNQGFSSHQLAVPTDRIQRQ